MSRAITVPAALYSVPVTFAIRGSETMERSLLPSIYPTRNTPLIGCLPGLVGVTPIAKTRLPPSTSPFFGEIKTYDVNTGAPGWRQLYAHSMMWGSLLSTGGNLVFGGGTNDREFRAYDATTGEELWHSRTNSAIIAPPASYEVNGVQYVAVQSGYGVDAAYQETLLSELLGWQADVPQGGVVWVYALSK